MKKTVKKHVAEAALVSFTFASVLPGGAAFAAADVTDVNGHWAEQAIHDWMERGYIGGYEDNTFRPNQTITRAEFVKLVNKTIDADQTATIAFSDVSDSDWFAGEVALALGEGYVSGFEDGTFRPGEPVTRAQAAAFLAKALKLTGDADAVADMTDSAAIPDWAVGAIGAVVAEGYMGGYEDGTFRPNRPLTRAEAVSMLNRVLNDDGNEDTKPPVVIGGGGGSSSGGSSGGGSVTRYTVTFDTDGGSTVASVTVKRGDKLTKPADPTKTGYTFGGWYTDKACTTPWNFENDTVREATTLYAKWDVASVSSVKVVDGKDGYTPVTNPVAGQVLYANVMLSDGTEIGTYPVDDRVTYKWYYEGSDDAVLGTKPTYTVTRDNVGKKLCVTVAVKGYKGEVTWTAAAAVPAVTVSSVAVVDGADGFTPVTNPRAGQVLNANVMLSDGTEIGVYPVNADVTYEWYYKESPETVLGTEPTYTVTTDNAGKTLCVTVTVKDCEGEATWTAAKAVAE